ncbi:MAG TPA: hypothetical protein VGT02_14425 [Methylomirabilota bacterium]|jgi:hypothetical protein|nr:hypothetical protein [Methylomirabilota bacterium]
MAIHATRFRLILGLGVTLLLPTTGSAAAEMGVVGKYDPATGAGEVKLASAVRQFACPTGRAAAGLRAGLKVEVDVAGQTLLVPGGRVKCQLVAQRSQTSQPPEAALCAANQATTPVCLAMPGPTQPPGTPVPAVAVGQTCYLPGVGNPGSPGQCAALRTACPSGAGYKFEHVGCCMSALGNPTSGPVYALVTCRRTQ